MPIPKATDGWKRVSRTFRIDPGADFVRFMLDAYDGTGFLVDDVRFEEQKADGTFGMLAVGALAIPEGATVRLVVSDVSALRGQSFKLVDSGAVTGSGWTVETSPAVKYVPSLRIAADGLYVDFAAPGMMLIFR